MTGVLVVTAVLAVVAVWTVLGGGLGACRGPLCVIESVI